jgi:hypothetical protein
MTKDGNLRWDSWGLAWVIEEAEGEVKGVGQDEQAAEGIDDFAKHLCRRVDLL